MYEKLTDVPEPIREYYSESDEGVVTLNTPTERKSMGELERVIALGKPTHVLSKFAECVATDDYWSFFDLYQEWLAECEAINTHNEALIEAKLAPAQSDEDGEYIAPEPTPLPSEPTKPTFRTGEEVLAPYQRELFKKERTEKVAKLTVEVDDMVFDADEVSQARMARAILVLEPEDVTMWVLADNNVISVTKDQLVQALKAAGLAQSAVWVKG